MVATTSRPAMVAIGAFLVIVAVIMVLPFINIIAVSLSGSRAIMSNEVALWPVDFTTKTYENVFRDGTLIRNLRNTIAITIGGTALNMAGTILIAYPLSRPKLRGRKVFLSMIIFTMLFNGGLIPTYVLVQQLGLLNTFWAVWLTGLVSTWNLFIMKTFFGTIPSSLIEAADIDGANDGYILIRIVLPLSLPVIATLTLFYAVGHWNSYFNVMLYITRSDLQTVMVRLVQMIRSVDPQLLENAPEGSDVMQYMTPEGVQAAAIVIATVPILAVYPFLQKYFVKGVMIGSLKQ
jgi:putative aldouronate transport system permease protein